MSLKGKLASIGLDPITQTPPTITISEGVTQYESNFEIQLLDSAGGVLATPQCALVWISDSADGSDVTANTPSGTTGVDGAADVGVVLSVLITKKAWIVLTNSTGLFNLSVITSTNQAMYVCVQPIGSPTVTVSRITTGADFTD